MGFRLKFGFCSLMIFISLLVLGEINWIKSETWMSESSLKVDGGYYNFGFALHGQPVADLVFDGALGNLLLAAASICLCIMISLLLGFWVASLGPRSKSRALVIWFLDVFSSVPGFFWSALILYGIDLGVFTLPIAFVFASWESSVRLFWSVANLVFSRLSYQADVALGFSSIRLFLNHYIPDVWGPMSVKFCSMMASYVIFGASAVVLGLVDSSKFPWGTLIQQGRQYFDIAPHVFWIGWFLVFWLTLSFTFLSSGIHLLFDKKNPR